MPASFAIPATGAFATRSTAVERSVPNRRADRIAPPPPAAVAAPTPLEAPSEIAPESGAENGAEGVAGGVPGGIPGGVVGATALDGGPGDEPAGPLRVGGGVKPPRKIKDVKPVFPPGVLADQMRGTVVMEATIDTDGKVQSAKIVHSVPALDAAALDAVRQWEYLPSTFDGRPVAVVITVVVNFTIQ
jgi:protein TonB